MMLNIICGNKSFTINLDDWNYFRYEIFMSCIEHLDYLYKKYENMDDKDIDAQNLYYGLRSIFTILEPEWKIKITDKNYYSYVTKMINTDLAENFIIMDAFINTQTIGSLKLANKIDCIGYYSPGDSYDILNTLDSIKFNNPNTIRNIRPVWVESVNRNLVVRLQT